MQRRIIALTLCLGLTLMFGSSVALAQYKLTNLVSNQVGQATHTDPLVVNAWGLVHAPGSPFWISDEGSGWSTLYTGGGVKVASLEVEIPSANGAGTGSPTGIVWNGSSDQNEFQVQGWPSVFLFATLDGTISGWAPKSDFNNAIIAVTKAGGSYTGLAITNNATGNFLYAADNANNKVDMYDANFKLVNTTAFADPSIPAGFAPFGIQDIDGVVYVAYASQSGASGGFIDSFTESGTLVKRAASGAPLNQPWGMAAAPSNFGPLSNTLLVSNNVNKTGTINGFNPMTRQFVGTIRDTNGKPIHIDQLWGIEFGGGTPENGHLNELFFTAGPSNNLAGTFGSISVK
jgi:uncharacterized protein (TIGR03118 family)